MQSFVLIIKNLGGEKQRERAFIVNGKALIYCSCETL